MTISVRKLP